MKKKIKKLLINSGIAGLLVLFGSFSDGSISIPGLIAAISACVIVFLTKFKEGINKKGNMRLLFEFI